MYRRFGSGRSPPASIHFDLPRRQRSHSTAVCGLTSFLVGNEQLTVKLYCSGVLVLESPVIHAQISVTVMALLERDRYPVLVSIADRDPRAPFRMSCGHPHNESRKHYLSRYSS